MGVVDKQIKKILTMKIIPPVLKILVFIIVLHPFNRLRKTEYQFFIQVLIL